MDKDSTLVQVTPEDLVFTEQELAKSRKPVPTRELAEKLAFRKTAGQRTQEVKLYDQACVYQVGDMIYKEYDEPLTVSSKTVEPFKGAVVLTVVRKIAYAGLGEMLEVDYSGGGVFRRYIDYIKKSKTQDFLPSNVGGANQAPLVMGRDDDPRLTELPMMDRDLKALEKNLKTALSKVTTFFSWGDHWQLTAQQPGLPEEKIKEIEDHITAARESAATTDLVRKYFGLEPSSDLFDLTCLALSHYLEAKRKKDFLLVSPVEWGRWHLKSVLNSLPEGLALSAKEAPLVAFESPEMPEPPETHGFPLKVYLSWREIVSGGVRVPKAFNKDLSHSREYTFIDADDNKSLTAYYYPTLGFFLGFQAFFAAHNIPQGTSITLEKKDATHILFRLKKSKKKISAARASYDAAADAFVDVTEAATLAMPNKIISIERETLQKLVALTPEREGKNLGELLVLVFKNFAGIAVGHALHYLRAFHLVDVLKKTTSEDVELTLLNTPEFTKSDKTKGLYIYHEALPVPEERPVRAAAAERPAAAAPASETGAAPGTILYDEFEGMGESPLDVIQQAELEAEMEAESPEFTILKPAPPVVIEPPPPPPTPVHVPAPPVRPIRPAGPSAPAAPGTTTKTGEVKKEKPHKKKKGKLEGEKVVRPGKSERRVIEERIEMEEGDLEALLAEKAVEKDKLEDIVLIAAEPAEGEAADAAAIAAENAPPPISKTKARKAKAAAEAAAAAADAEAAEGAEEAEAAEEEPAAKAGAFGNLFAERLKVALAKKRQEAQDAADKKPDTE